ncbi:MAG: molybdopterin-dependent oxidoreductase, partial [Gemmataceae bacterium]|nr:molybdopterin-dependent oxidoreductase [Gemmataceae bacterium]
MDRRDFLVNLSVIPASTLICACGTAEAAGPGVKEADLTWGKAPCRYCGTGCGVEVGVDAGKVVAVRGDVASPVNRGLLCVKGYHLPGMLYGADRLTHPLKRDPSGKGFIKITWDEALDTIAKRFRETLEKHGPEAVGMYGSGQWTVFDGYAALKWLKGGMKTNNIEPNARLCMASAVTGYMTQ